MKKYRIGYTQGVFDMFHIGHLNLLNHAKEQCEYLLVGVNSDDLVKQYKGFIPNIPEEHRLEIVENIKAVDQAFVVNTLDKSVIFNQNPFDAIFIGSDWKGSERWIQTEEELKKVGAEVVYLQYTGGISSTILRQKICSKEACKR